MIAQGVATTRGLRGGEGDRQKRRIAKKGRGEEGEY